MKVHIYEKAFLSIGGGMLVLFLGALAFATLGAGIHLPDRAGAIDPTMVRTTPPFDNPGVREIAPGRYEVVMIGQVWSFLPNEVRVPAGSEVVFRMTSPDVIHGMHIEHTTINVMLIPGQISEVRYTFKEPREHLIICHEYCGLGHHLMYGKVIVE
jgi:cytochrome c oxidase subunit II